MPERFIDDNGKLTDDDPAQYIFGLGRRICPGGSSSFHCHKAYDELSDQVGILPMLLCGLPLQPCWPL